MMDKNTVTTLLVSLSFSAVYRYFIRLYELPISNLLLFTAVGATFSTLLVLHIKKIHSNNIFNRNEMVLLVFISIIFSACVILVNYLGICDKSALLVSYTASLTIAEMLGSLLQLAKGPMMIVEFFAMLTDNGKLSAISNGNGSKNILFMSDSGNPSTTGKSISENAEQENTGVAQDLGSSKGKGKAKVSDEHLDTFEEKDPKLMEAMYENSAGVLKNYYSTVENQIKDIRDNKNRSRPSVRLLYSNNLKLVEWRDNFKHFLDINKSNLEKANLSKEAQTVLEKANNTVDEAYRVLKLNKYPPNK